MNDEGEVGAGDAVSLLQHRRTVANVVGSVDATDDDRLSTATDAGELDHNERLQVRLVGAAVRETVNRQTGGRVDGRRAVCSVRSVPLHTFHTRVFCQFYELLGCRRGTAR